MLQRDVADAHRAVARRRRALAVRAAADPGGLAAVCRLRAGAARAHAAPAGDGGERAGAASRPSRKPSASIAATRPRTRRSPTAIASSARPGGKRGRRPSSSIARSRAVDRALALDPIARRGLRGARDGPLQARLGSGRRERRHRARHRVEPQLRACASVPVVGAADDGQFDDAVRSARRARDLDPLSVDREHDARACASTTRAGTPRRSRPSCAPLRLDPDFAVVHWGLGETYRELGRQAEAVAELRRAVERSNGSPYMRAWLAHALAARRPARGGARHPPRPRAHRGRAVRVAVPVRA